jgi:hypothetical protein
MSRAVLPAAIEFRLEDCQIGQRRRTSPLSEDLESAARPIAGFVAGLAYISSTPSYERHVRTGLADRYEDDLQPRVHTNKPASKANLDNTSLFPHMDFQS